MIMLWSGSMPLGEGEAPRPSFWDRKENGMRIHVYKELEGVRSIMVVPGRSAHMAPVLIRGTDKAAVLEEAVEVIDRAARRRGEPDVPPAS